MNNEPVAITLPISKAKVTLRPYPTARMEQAQTAVFLRHSKINMKDIMTDKKAGQETKAEDVLSIDELPAEAIVEIDRITVQNFVLTINGDDFDKDREKMLEYCLDELHKDDFKAIVTKCNQINKASETTPEKKAE